MTDEWAELLKTLAEEAESGNLLSVAWLADRGGRNRRFGHIGFTEGREVLTDSLLTPREPKAAGKEIN